MEWPIGCTLKRGRAPCGGRRSGVMLHLLFSVQLVIHQVERHLWSDNHQINELFIAGFSELKTNRDSGSHQ
jgi:hypothetical protein